MFWKTNVSQQRRSLSYQDGCKAAKKSLACAISRLGVRQETSVNLEMDKETKR